MSIADAVDKDCNPDAITSTYPRMQRGSGDSEKGLVDRVMLFIERNTEDVASTLGWRGRVLHLQEATQVIRSHQRHMAEERWRASLEIEIRQIRRLFSCL